MAAKGSSSSGKIHCPVCGATSTNAHFGNDGQKRTPGGCLYTEPTDPLLQKKRARARAIRAQNAFGKR